MGRDVTAGLFMRDHWQWSIRRQLPDVLGARLPRHSIWNENQSRACFPPSVHDSRYGVPGTAIRCAQCEAHNSDPISRMHVFRITLNLVASSAGVTPACEELPQLSPLMVCKGVVHVLLLEAALPMVQTRTTG